MSKKLQNIYAMSKQVPLGANVDANTYNGGPRNEITNVKLNIVQGTLPTDLHGVAFFGSMCGSVNSGGLPFPRNLPNGDPNPEFGTPFMNGDGLVFSVDMQQSGEVVVNSRFMKTPSFYADQATALDGPARQQEKFKHFHFDNHGLARMSLLLGARNYVNTALIPVDFGNDSGPALIATIDNGRPFKLNPATLELITPIGYNDEWISAMPPFLRMPFPMFDTTAHPSYDAKTKEFFSVNYTQSTETEMSRSFLADFLRRDKHKLEKRLTDIATRHQEHQDDEKAIKEIKDLVASARKESKHGTNSGCLTWLANFLYTFFGDLVAKWIDKETQTIDQVHLIKFDNQGELQKWRLVDETGKNLVIDQCMHQTSLSENYILLMDSSFKFAFELLINNPFPKVKVIDRFIRAITAKKLEPTTEMWIVNRKDLIDGVETVKTTKLKQNIPFECLHFSTEYDDTNDQVTIYTAHNNAACFAEWIREYDNNFFNDDTYPDTLIGDFATGEMSVGALGKFTIDAQRGTIVEEKILREIGRELPPPESLSENLVPIQNVGPNTWGIGLYTYRNMISPTIPNRKIKKLFFINYGSNPNYLTKWVHDLYANYKNRDIPLDTFLAYTKRGIPPSLIVVDTDTMTFSDFYQFDMNQHPMSIQYVPRKVRNEQIPAENDGYILLTLKSPFLKGTEVNYESQLWVMDANDIAKGPVCVLTHPDFEFCFTVHNAWLKRAENIDSAYQVNIRKDYNQTIRDALLFFEDIKYEEFFNEYVYPHFENDSE